MSLYMNGASVATQNLPARAVYPLTYEKIFESAHPLPRGSTRVIEVSLPEQAHGGEISFDARCSMGDEDSLTFYKDKECTAVVNDTILGGGDPRGVVLASYPGVGSMPALRMTDIKTVYMKATTGVGESWGFRMVLSITYTSEVEKEVEEAHKEDAKVIKSKTAVLNKMPFYIGQRPAYVCNSFTLTKNCFHGFIGKSLPPFFFLLLSCCSCYDYNDHTNRTACLPSL